MPNPYEDQKLYSEDELKQIIYGLMNVYWGKPWYLRWLYKPWHDALQTFALIVAGKSILKDVDNQRLLDDVEGFINN